MRKLGILVIVFAGLLSLGQGIALLSSLGFTITSLRGADVPARIPVMFFAAGVFAAFLLGVLLIAFRRPLAAALFDDGEVGLSVSAADLLHVGIVLVGLNLGATAIVGWFTSLSSGYFQQSMMGGRPLSGISWLLSSSAWSSLAKLAVGIVLILASRWLSNLLMRAPQDMEPKSIAVSEACPSCGAPFDPADYREGAERYCPSCHNLM